MTDNNGQPLGADECRARAEFTLRGGELVERGITDLASLEAYRFRSLANLLHFRRFKPLQQVIEGMHPAAAYAVRHYRQRGSDAVTTYPFGWTTYEREKRTGQPRHGGKAKDRAHNGHTVADDALNHVAGRKFDDLSRRFSA